MYYFNLCILDIDTRSFSTVALVAASVLVIFFLFADSDCCCSRKKLQKEIWYMFFQKEGLYELTCCSPRDISAEHPCWKECSGEGPQCQTSLLPSPPQPRKKCLPEGLPWNGIGLRVPVWVTNCQLWSVCGAAVRRSCGFSWGCRSCTWWPWDTRLASPRARIHELHLQEELRQQER